MKGYGNNYVLKYVQMEKNGKIIFDVIDEMGFNRVVDGKMQDLKRILKFSNDLTPEDDIRTIQDSLIQNPIIFIAKRKPLKNMDELDFNI